MIKEILFSIVLGVVFLNTKTVEAQSPCFISYDTDPACNIAECHLFQYRQGDTVSYGGKDYVLNNEAFVAAWTPNFGALSGYWTEITPTCGISLPTFYDTQVRANYCTTAMPVGRIASKGGYSSLSERGFVYGTSANPNYDDDQILQDAGFSVGDEFEGLMENLTPETTYYVRTFARNGSGISYGTEVEFTTRKLSECVSDCNLACDITTPSLLDPTPAAFPAIIGVNDTVCLTQDLSISGGTTIQGMLKLCNDAQFTFVTNIEISRSIPFNTKGQIVYEGCNERTNGTGSYAGENVPGYVDTHDMLQMISYCGSCTANDRTQFFDDAVDIDHWGATCRPTTTLLNPLPVELIAFNVKGTDNGVELSWTTASETENSHFEAEYSYDGVNWYTVGYIQGAGNSTSNLYYSFLHEEHKDGVMYYRLRQIDFDGSENISNVIHYSFDEEAKPKGFIAYQNSNNQVEISAKFSGMGEAMLFDTRGKLVESKTFISTNKSGTKIIFDATGLSEGIYYVRIKSDNVLMGEKVQITK